MDLPDICDCKTYAGRSRIPDGPSQYQDSVVVYTRFRCRDLQEMFARLREREWILRRDKERAAAGSLEEWQVRQRLEEVEAVLIWMTHNVANGEAELLNKRGI